MSPVEPVPTAVVYDVNELVTAVASGNSPFRSWPSPPPTSGNPCADCVGIIVDAAEFALWLSPHILANIRRVSRTCSSGTAAGRRLCHGHLEGS